jgi:hypothetical protein
MFLNERAHARLHALHDGICSRAKTWAVYATALVLALPDILDALAGIDVTPLLPAWLPGGKFAAGLAVARIVLGAYVRHLPRPEREGDR